jgi:hypothetical protein
MPNSACKITFLGEGTKLITQARNGFKLEQI